MSHVSSINALLNPAPKRRRRRRPSPPPSPPPTPVSTSDPSLGSSPSPAPSSVTPVSTSNPALTAPTTSSTALSGTGTSQTQQRRQQRRPQREERQALEVPDFVPDEFKGDIRRAARQNGIRPELLAAQLRQESGFDPNAVSPAGAGGIAQFMPGTAEAVGLRDRFDPKQAIAAQGRLMRQLLDQFNGREDLALSAYNAGAGAVQEAGNRVPAIPETQNYVQSILGTAGRPTAADSARRQRTAGAAGGGGPTGPSRRAIRRFTEGEDPQEFQRLIGPLQRRIVRLGRRSGEPVDINSGFRTRGEQQELFNRFQAGTGNLAAPPGSSQHEFGGAVDVNLTGRQRELLPQLGLETPVPGEPWHVELIDGKPTRVPGPPPPRGGGGGRTPSTSPAPTTGRSLTPATPAPTTPSAPSITPRTLAPAQRATTGPLGSQTGLLGRQGGSQPLQARTGTLAAPAGGLDEILQRVRSRRRRSRLLSDEEEEEDERRRF